MKEELSGWAKISDTIMKLEDIRSVYGDLSIGVWFGTSFESERGLYIDDFKLRYYDGHWDSVIINVKPKGPYRDPCRVGPEKPGGYICLGQERARILRARQLEKEQCIQGVAATIE